MATAVDFIQVFSSLDPQQQASLVALAAIGVSALSVVVIARLASRR